MDAQACLCNTYCLHSESSFSGAGRNLTAIERRCRPIIQHRGVAIQLQSSADATEGPRLSQPKIVHYLVAIWWPAASANHLVSTLRF